MKNLEDSFLKGKYWGDEEFRKAVGKSAEKKKRLTKEEIKTSQKPEEQIIDYLERIERVTQRTDPRTGERGKLFLETSLYPRYVIKPENISDEYIKNVLLGNFAEQRGYNREALKNEEVRAHILAQFKQETGKDLGSYQIPEKEKEEIKTMIISDQQSRLKQWFEYLTSDEAHNVPSAFRYWAFAEMLKLGSYDEERKTFNRRTENTTASFPELDQQALALVFDEIQRKLKGEPSQITEESFKKILQSENFGRLYGYAIEHLKTLRLPTERLIITKGVWRCFPKGTSAKEVISALQGFHTQWCIAGEGYASNYLQHSEF
jgi:hypothetical protein